jgi:aldehyde:ferredoxin oxidoreductase
MLFAYYEARGWDLETSKPSQEKLIELGLEEVIKDLW